MREITVAAAVEEVSRVTDFVNARLAELGCPERTRIQVDVAVDEIFSNIANYAYGPERGEATVRVDVEEEPLCVVLSFVDRGRPFDPLSRGDPDITLPAAERPIGGLGLFMVRQTMDGVEYACRDGRNILTIRKRI